MAANPPMFGRKARMTDEQKAAYIYAQAACANAEIEAMKADNQYRKMRGGTIAYDGDAFREIIEKYGIHHNAICSLFHDC